MSAVGRSGNGAGDGMRRCCVLDIEVTPDHHARVLAGRRGAVPMDSPLNRIVNASVMTFRRDGDGRLADFDLVSFHTDVYQEADVVANVDRVLAGVHADGGMLVTYNGIAHDVPILRGRQLRWWQCSAVGVAAFAEGKGDHLDLMIEVAGSGRRWAKLSDACASVGFSLRGPVPIGGERTLPYEVEKCELDVVGTTVLLLYVLAARSRSDEPLSRGLPALGRRLRQIVAGRPHLERFALSPLLGEDACAWGGDVKA